jgi:hypothetical protein
MLERRAANDWKVQPSGLLAHCLRNIRSAEDHAYQDKRCIDEMLETGSSKNNISPWLTS